MQFPESFQELLQIVYSHEIKQEEL
jgi:hypothetical protein